MHTNPSISGRKYRKSVYNAVFIRNKSSNVVSAAATSAFQLKHTPRLLYTQHMPCGLSNTDHRIWENISHVALREILLARIRSIYIYIYIYIDNFPFSPQVWGERSEPQLNPC